MSLLSFWQSTSKIVSIWRSTKCRRYLQLWEWLKDLAVKILLFFLLLVLFLAALGLALLYLSLMPGSFVLLWTTIFLYRIYLWEPFHVPPQGYCHPSKRNRQLKKYLEKYHRFYGFLYLCIPLWLGIMSLSVSWLFAAHTASAEAAVHWSLAAERSFVQFKETADCVASQFYEINSKWDAQRAAFESSYLAGQRFHPSYYNLLAALSRRLCGVFSHGVALDMIPPYGPEDPRWTAPWNHRGLPPDCHYFAFYPSHWIGLGYQITQSIFSLVNLQHGILVRSSFPLISSLASDVGFLPQWTSNVGTISDLLGDFGSHSVDKIPDQILLFERQLDACSTSNDYRKFIQDVSLLEAQFIVQWKETLEILAHKTVTLSRSLYLGSFCYGILAFFSYFEVASMSQTATSLWANTPPWSPFPGLWLSLAFYEQGAVEIFYAVRLCRCCYWSWDLGFSIGSLSSEIPSILNDPTIFNERLAFCCWQFAYPGFPEGPLTPALWDYWNFAVGHIFDRSFLWELEDDKPQLSDYLSRPSFSIFFFGKP